MIEIEHHEQDLLRRARRALSPSSADAERIRSQVAAVISTGAALPSGGALAAPVGVARRLAPVVALALGLAAAGGVGYHFGFAAGSARAPRSTPTNGGPVSPRSEPVIAPVAPETPDSPSPAPANTPARGATTPAPPNGHGPDPSLGDEARLLARVERALRDGNPRFALGLLGELDRTTPGGQLVEERHAARVIAQCQLGGEVASARARDFTARYPTSAYRSRIRQTCRDALGGEE